MNQSNQVNRLKTRTIDGIEYQMIDTGKIIIVDKIKLRVFNTIENPLFRAKCVIVDLLKYTNVIEHPLYWDYLQEQKTEPDGTHYCKDDGLVMLAFDTDQDNIFMTRNGLKTYIITSCIQDTEELINSVEPQIVDITTFEQLANKSIRITDFIGQITYLGHQVEIMTKTKSTTQKYIKGYLNLNELIPNFDINNHIEQIKSGQILIILGTGIESGIYFCPSIVTETLMLYKSNTINSMKSIINQHILTENTQDLISFDYFISSIKSKSSENQKTLIDERLSKLQRIIEQTVKPEIKLMLTQELDTFSNKLIEFDLENKRELANDPIQKSLKLIQDRFKYLKIEPKFSSQQLLTMVQIANSQEQAKHAPNTFTEFKSTTGFRMGIPENDLNQGYCWLPVIQIIQSFNCYCHTGLSGKKKAPPSRIFFIYNKKCELFTLRDIAYQLELQNIKISYCNHTFFEGLSKKSDDIFTISFGS